MIELIGCAVLILIVIGLLVMDHFGRKQLKERNNASQKPPVAHAKV